MSNLMDFNATIDLIIRELDEAREIIEDLKKLPDAPILEIEMARSKCRNAAEAIAMLKQVKSAASPVPKKPESSVENNEFQEVKQAKEVKAFNPEPVPEPVTEPKKPDTKTPDIKVEETILFKMPDPIVIPAGEKQAKRVYNNDLREKPAPSIRSEEKKVVSQPGKAEDKKDPGKPEIDSSDKKPFVAPIIADTFSHLANRFNEHMNEDQDEDFSFTHRRRYTNISDAIGVNDRFYYIREVFGGDREAYSEAVSRLETAKSMSEAREIVKSYRKDATENKASRELLELVRRKFGKNE